MIAGRSFLIRVRRRRAAWIAYDDRVFMLEHLRLLKNHKGAYMFGYISLLISQVGLTGKQWAMKKCGKETPGIFNSICINGARSLICLLVSAVIWALSGGGVTTAAGHAVAVISGVGTALNLFTWILASNIVPLILIECLSMIGSMIIPMILAPYIYSGDAVSLLQWVGCALIFLSVFLFLNRGSEKKSDSSTAYKMLIVTVCTLGTTLTSVFKKYYIVHFSDVGKGSVEYFTLISFAVVFVFFALLFAPAYSLAEKRLSANGGDGNVQLPFKKVWIYILTAAVLLYVNELFVVYAAELPSAIYFPLSRALAVSATFLLDVIVFKDKVSVSKLIGLALVIVSVVLINI